MLTKILSIIVALCGALCSAEPSPLATIEALHTALRNADRAMAESILHPAYSGVSLQGPAAARHVFVETRTRALDTIRTLERGSWDVKILDASERIDGNGMAHVWARYVFYLDGHPNHCGYESYVLYRDGGEWKVISFADTDNALDGKSVDAICPA